MDKDFNYSEEREFIFESEDSADLTSQKKEEMASLLSILSEEELGDIAPRADVKKALMAEFKKERKGSVLWLNSIAVWLWPQDVTFYKRPALQLAVAACCLLVVFNVIDSSSKTLDQENQVSQDIEDSAEKEEFTPEPMEEDEVGSLEESVSAEDKKAEAQTTILKDVVSGDGEGKGLVDSPSTERLENGVSAASTSPGGGAFGGVVNLSVADEELLDVRGNEYSSDIDAMAEAPAPPDGYYLEDGEAQEQEELNALDALAKETKDDATVQSKNNVNSVKLTETETVLQSSVSRSAKKADKSAGVDKSVSLAENGSDLIGILYTSY